MSLHAPLIIAVAQPHLVPFDIAANALAHAAAVRSAAARVVVFPELSLTGYELDAPAISTDDPRLAPIVTACAEMGSLALVGAPFIGDVPGSAHIGTLAIDGDGVRLAYRKVWLGAVEAERFRPGPAPVILEVGGWRLGLAICRDTGMPQHAAGTAALGMDAYVAGTVKHDHEGAVQAERARRVAVEHGVWVAVASFAGPTGGGFAVTAGRSSIWAPDGTLVAEAGPEPGAIVRATLA